MGFGIRRICMRFQVRHILLGVLGLVSLVAIAAIGWNAHRTLLDLETTRWLVYSNEIAEASLRLNEAAALERGITSILLAGQRNGTEGAGEMRRQRLAVDRYHAEVVDATRLLANGPQEHPLSQPLARLEAAREAFEMARTEVDSILKSDRGVAAQSWIGSASRYIEEVARIRRSVFNSANALDRVLHNNLFVKEVFFTATEYAGRERAIVGSAIAAGRGFTPDEYQQLLRYRTLVETSLGKVENELSAIATDGAVGKAYAQLQAGFLGHFEELRQAVYAASAGDAPYPVQPLDWYREATAAIGTILDLSDTVGRHMRIDIVKVEQHAQWLLAALFGTCILVLLTFVVAFAVIRLRILHPLKRLCSSAQHLGAGQLRTPLPPLAANDEFSFLRDVLESMRVNLLADIQRRERAEREARKLASAISQSTEAVIISDREGVIEYVNPALEAMRGYSHREIVGRTLTWLGSHTEGGNPAARFQSVLTAGESFSATFRNRRKNGETYYEETTVSPLRDESGTITHLVTTGRNITERMNSQKELKVLYRAIEQSVSSVVITDKEGIVEYVNPQFTRTTGYSGREMIGRKLDTLSAGETNEATYRELWQTISAGDVWEGELLNRKKSGERYWELVSISPVAENSETVTHFVGIYHDVTQRKFMEERLHQLAYYDELTGLPNRTLFGDRLSQAIAYAERKDSRFAVLFIDLDHFKLVNDSLGHEAGDEVVRTAAERIRHWSRNADTVARYSGDEFVLLMLDLERIEDVTIAARRLLESIAKPVVINGNEIHTTCSIGASVYPEDGTVTSLLLRNADAAMYRAKEMGRNRIAFYTEDLSHQATQRLALESELRRGLEREEFVLYYQPQVSLVDRSVVGMEALIRWLHPTKGLLAPDHFLPVAEETGLIVAIGEWVLQKACHQARTWSDTGAPEVKVAVNVSARQLENIEFVDTVKTAIDESGILPQGLELEITESAFIADPDAALAMLRRLKAIGVALAVDDFGTGYSSLSYLQRFPFDKLKIDRSFISDITEAPDKAAIAAAITSMARTLKMSVIAEGVETDRQAYFLQERGCHEIQGYLISPPIPAAEASRFLERSSLPEAERHESEGTVDQPQ